LLAHSQDAGWRSLYAALIDEAPLTTAELSVGHPSLIFHVAHPTRVSRQLGGEQREHALIGPGRFCLTPGHVIAEWQHSGRPRILQLYLRRELYQLVAQELGEFTPEQAELSPRFAIVDPSLEQLVLSVLTALRSGAADDGLYVDYLAQMLAAHLFKHYSGRRVLSPGVAYSSAVSLDRVLDFVEAHLDSDLSLARMARPGEIGQLGLSRAFRSRLGQTPHQYVLRRHIERARQLLAHSDASIADIAQATGFVRSHFYHRKFMFFF
jgi:AraC family transcriptional regulator